MNKGFTVIQKLTKESLIRIESEDEDEGNCLVSDLFGETSTDKSSKELQTDNKLRSREKAKQVVLAKTSSSLANKENLIDGDDLLDMLDF